MSSLRPARVLSAADKAYRALLFVYPAAHRREYGPLMAELFRDLCRDAVQQGGTFALFDLWLRTLLDMAVTAVSEHLYEKGRTPMTNVLHTDGLIPALEAYWGELTGTEDFEVHLTVDGQVPRLIEGAESAIFNAVGEAIGNAKAHAQANNVWIAVRCQHDTLEVSVRDDGQGFNVDRVRTECELGGGPDEIDMSDRVQVAQGTMSVQSAVGEGTTVRISVPVAPNLEAKAG